MTFGMRREVLFWKILRPKQDSQTVFKVAY